MKDFESERIVWLKCRHCASEFPTVVFQGDTDMATEPYRTKTDHTGHRLFVFSKGEDPKEGKWVHVAQTERANATPGESFTEFFERSKTGRHLVLYGCIECDSGLAEIVCDLTEPGLVEKGYSVVRSVE